MGCTSLESVYEKADNFLQIKFDTVIVDSSYLANGFQNAIKTNDSINNIPEENFENISLDSLDMLDNDNKVIYEPLPKPKKKKLKSSLLVKRKFDYEDDFHKKDMEFQRKVFEYKILLHLIDTSKKNGKR